MRSRFHQPEAGKWGGVGWGGEGGPIDRFLGPGKGTFYFKAFRKRLKIADLQALHASLKNWLHKLEAASDLILCHGHS